MEQGSTEKYRNQGWSQTSQERVEEYECDADDKSLKR
jgi:hypothetical protein